MLRLGVNLDHVATLRQARREKFPSPALAAKEAQAGGADSITVHLREDRRHIQDHDLFEIRRACDLPLNLEMALTPEMIQMALDFRPDKVCFVPERRQELTTEGGLNLRLSQGRLPGVIRKFKEKKIEVSLFLDPAIQALETAARAGADAVEIHTGAYARATGKRRRSELERVCKAASLAGRLGLKVHAGHGLDYANVRRIAKIREVEEVNIGFSIIARAVFVGLRQAVREMKQLLGRR